MTTQTPGVGATDAAEAAARGITAPRVPQPPVIPADLNPDDMSDAQVVEAIAAIRRLFPDVALAADVELWEQEVGA